MQNSLQLSSRNLCFSSSVYEVQLSQILLEVEEEVLDTFVVLGAPASSWALSDARVVMLAAEKYPNFLPS